MEASRTTIIKTVLARNGPKTMHQLFMALKTSFPEQFESLTRTKYKTIYINGLKKLNQINIKVHRDPELLEKLRSDPTSRIHSTDKEAWMIHIHENLEARYSTPDGNADPNHSEILAQVNGERIKSKDFWEGKTNTPHDWKSILKGAGVKL